MRISALSRIRRLVIPGIIAVSLAPAFSACGGASSPLSPTSSGAPAGGVPIQVVLVSLEGPFSASLAGQTFTATGLFTVRLPIGTHEISGTFAGAAFGVEFGRAPGETRGVLSGSLQTMSGPNAFVDQCRVSYIPPPGGGQHSFRLRFTVTENHNSACQ
jgi:hypothetical protein